MTAPTSTSTRQAGVDLLGVGDPTLLLLPGWCGDRTVFAPLVKPLSADRRVLVTDLRGHGGNIDQTGDFASERQVDDLVGLINEMGVERVVPVALSHAGWLAIELRRRLGPDRIPGLVLLDWMVLGTPPGFEDALTGLQSPDTWQDVRAALFGMWTAGITNQEVHDYVASMGNYGFEYWRRAGREISAGFATSGAPLVALEALSPSCPTLHLYAQPADDGYLAAQERLAAEHPWFTAIRLDAMSHFPMFEVPDAMASLIEEFTCSLG